jgi:polyketide synthase PksN
VLGGVAYCAYSSANAYMDYFVSSKARELPHWKSVNLGEMLFTHEQAKREDMNMSRSSLKPSEICELFEWSLGAGTNVVIETAIDLQERIYQTYVSDKNTIISGVFDPESISASERPGLSTEYHEPVTETEKKLVILISNFFGITGIGIHDNFFELGGDSLKAMVVSKRIKKDFGVGITIKEFFMNPTVHKISIIIDETLFLVQKKERASKTII